MRILIDLGHPAHVHLFKNFIWEMEKEGHSLKIIARDKDVTRHLLEAFKIPHEIVGVKKAGTIHLLFEWIYRDIKIFLIAYKFKPDILMGSMNPAIVHSAILLRKKSFIFTDSEPEAMKFPIADIIAIPFADVILTISSVRHYYGKKEIRINSFKELAYLHPNWFNPNPSILKLANISDGEPYVILRFVAWGAYHDVGNAGFDLQAKRQLIETIEPHARVFISSEIELTEEFEKYRIPIRPEQIHDFLYYARLLVCDSQTMATEAAVLGTPVIRCNSFVGDKDMGNFVELEKKYGLIFNYRDSAKAIAKCEEIITNHNDLKRVKRDTLIKEKVDLTKKFLEIVKSENFRFKS